MAIVAMTVIRRSSDSPSDEQAVCGLPRADRAQRTSEFRALFESNEVRRERTPTGVRWSMPGGDNIEAESRRLAALEERCCDGIEIHVHREATTVVWDITGPPATTRLLDAFYELPVLITSEAGAEQLWTTLDAAACGPSKP